MIIEDKPYYKSRRYYGSIILPGIETVLKNSDGSIPFSIEVIEVDWAENPYKDKRIFTKRYHISCLLKDTNYKRVAGKKLRYITEQILQEIKDKKIVL